MGLTNTSTGLYAKDEGLVIKKRSENDKIIALAGNPNVGKSTLFNALTGMKQHTGNWPGKTVANAQGWREHNGRGYVFVDIPGSYSLLAHSAEEEVAGEFICSGVPDAVAVVCGASCLERNLNLVLQISEVTDNLIVCVNLMDEAQRKGIDINCTALSEKLGVPVIPMNARDGVGIDKFLDELEKLAQRGGKVKYSVDYGQTIMHAAALTGEKGRNALKIIEDYDLSSPAVKYLAEMGIDKTAAEDSIAKAVAAASAELAKDVVTLKSSDANAHDRKLDKIFTSKLTGFPVMALMLAIVFWITITGANVPSQMLNDLLFGFEDNILTVLRATPIPAPIVDMLVFGMYRVLAWVISVMLPPMAIFFPMFTILEDSGYLPRVAFNLDKCFKKCRACGKQALTMCIVYIILYQLNTPFYGHIKAVNMY